MTIRHNTFAPSDILYASQVNEMSDNGVIQVDDAAELADASLEHANLAYVVSTFTLYYRKAAGVGVDKWEAV